MKVTVCELPDGESAFGRAWDRLAEHVSRERTDLVVLPEMPFAAWFAVAPVYDAGVWGRAVESHERWLLRLGELAPAAVLASRPVVRDPRRLNEAFVWDASTGYRGVHHKRYLPDEAGFWEARWYAPGDGDFTPTTVASARVGALICTEQWSMAHAQRYGKLGVQLIAIPRCSGRDTVEKWITGGRAVAVVSGAYSVSSNRSDHAGKGDFGGGGWVIDPDGRVIAVTTRDYPVRTVEIDRTMADAAKKTYPRYALD